MLTYQDVQGQLPTTRHLLLGNGFSMGCDSVFSYPNLFERAKEQGLSSEAVKVFEYLGTNNFEGVLRRMDDMSVFLEIYGGGDQILEFKRRLAKDWDLVRNCLIQSVASSHLSHPGTIPKAKLAACVEFLKGYENIFTTNYDLLTYWVTRVAQEDHGVQFQDGFRSPEGEPDSEYLVFSERIGRNRGLLFLHGALHLFVEEGETRKYSWKRSGKRITDLVASGFEERRYPLFVAEGNHKQKLAQIHSNDYLSYCLGRFEGIQNPLIIYGHSLGASDQHVLDAMVGAPKLAKVYIGLFGKPEDATNAKLRHSSDALIARRKALQAMDKRYVDLSIHFYSSESVQPWG